MYPGGRPEVTVDPGTLGERLEGTARPGHFRGVLTVVTKLLNLVGPCRVYFGEKDAQQLELVRRMVRSLDLPATLVSCPTEREPDGLAISSRNVLANRRSIALSRAIGSPSPTVTGPRRSRASPSRVPSTRRESRPCRERGKPSPCRRRAPEASLLRSRSRSPSATIRTS